MGRTNLLVATCLSVWTINAQAQPIQANDPRVDVAKAQYQDLLNKAAQKQAAKPAIPEQSAVDAEIMKASIGSSLAAAQVSDAESIRSDNVATLDSVTKAKIDAVRQNLPRDVWSGMAAQYAQGNVAMTTSEAGKIVVTLIRGLQDPKARGRNLQLIRKYAELNVPEALNFFGYLYETGLFVPKNLTLADNYYRAAGDYPPALLNLGLGAFYGRHGQKASNPGKAVVYLDRARSLAIDGSSRVCGWDSFVNWRLGNRDAAKVAAYGCGSALAALGQAMSEKDPERRMSIYAGFFPSGADDAFPEMARFTKDSYKSQAPEYQLINKYRWKTESKDVQSLAKELANAQGRDKPNSSDISAASSARLHVAKYRQAKESNKFQFGTPVPYLPFRQTDVDQFKKLQQGGPN